MESDSDNKVNEHLCSQKIYLFSVNVAKKFDYALALFHHVLQVCSPAWSNASEDPSALQSHGNSLGGEINVRNGNANEMHVKVLEF